MRRSKRYKQALELIDKAKLYSLEEVVDVLKSFPPLKFDETVEISCKLNADPKKPEQMVRSSVILPHGTGKKIKVLVFCEPEKEKEAKDAGADFVGGQDLIDKISKENWLNFDSCISTPGMMRIVSKIGRILGPRGMMPSPKTGAVTDNIAGAVKEAKTGKIEFRMDKLSCLAVGVGKLSFSKENLLNNMKAFLESLHSVKSQGIKGEFIKTIYVSSTMSPSLRLKM